MIPNLDFIRTMLNGIRESVFAWVRGTANRLEYEISNVEKKIRTPDYAAREGEPGYIANKPELLGRPGEGDKAEVFNDYENNAASGSYAHAEGRNTAAKAQAAHSEGFGTVAGGTQAHAEGRNTEASGNCAHAEGQGTHATGGWTHAEGYNTTASGDISHAEGNKTLAKGFNSHAEGLGTIAADYQHVQGKYNVEDTAYRYAHIVGNGTAEEARANAHTLDWSGNAWFAGSLEGTALILKTSGGKYFKLAVDDTGALKINEVLR